jgi:hypothetical protein
MKKTFASALIIAAVLAGCESPKEDVIAKDYVLIVHNVSSMGCTSFGMDAFKSEFGITREVLYHEDIDNTVDCNDYEHEPEKTCWAETLTGNGTGIGDHVCAIGIDEADEPDTSNEEVVKKQTYVAIIPNVSSLACTKGGIDKVLKDHGYSGTSYEFTQEEANINCDNFSGTTCQVLNGPDEDEAGYSKDFSCVIGTNDKPLNDN